ncbi:MAG: DNA methyltransferase [Erysipelotrichaceae bacterium]
MGKKKINDLNMKRWKEYDDIITDSLWIIDKRDNTGNNKGDYHGNFIPQIPYQLMQRYTKKGDWVLDPFLGSGTTLITCQQLGRNGIGIDIDNNILNIAKERATNEQGNSILEFLQGDSSKVDLNPILKNNSIDKVQMIIYHPPYWDIIKFNDVRGNIAHSDTLDEFLYSFEKIVDNTAKFLENNRYLAIVIGDIYKNSQWVPLNSYITQLMLNKNFILKSVVVKNISETKGKQNQKSLWKYRSLLGGFYVFSHEYILIFQKTRKTVL